MDCHHFTHLALYCPLHHRLAIWAHVVQQEQFLKWHFEQMNMTKINPFIFPLVPIPADKLQGCGTSPFLLLKPTQFIRHVQIIMQNSVMTRLRLLEEETTKPKDKEDIRYKNCCSACVRKGGRSRKQQIIINFND